MFGEICYNYPFHQLLLLLPLSVAITYLITDWKLTKRYFNEYEREEKKNA